MQRVMMLLLVVFGGYIAVDATSFFIAESSPLSGKNIPRKKIDARTQIDPSPLSLKEINRWNLFGSFQGNTDYDLNPAALSEIDLEIKLLGLFADSGKDRGAAIIMKSSNEEVLVSAGDYLDGNVRVSSILDDKVILEQAGEQKVLALIKWSDYKGIQPQVSEIAKQDREDASPEKAHAPPSYSKFIKHAGLKPVRLGLAAGYKVSESAEGIQKKYNLREGDVIISINGYPVGVEADDRLAGSSLMDGRGEMTVRRDGENFLVKVRP